MTETNELLEFMQKMGNDAEEKWNKICEDCRKRGYPTPYIEDIFKNAPEVGKYKDGKMWIKLRRINSNEH